MEITSEVEEIIIASIEKTISDGRKLTVSEFLLCSDELKKTYFKSQNYLSVTELKLCSEEVITEYINMVCAKDSTFNDSAFNVFSDNNKMYYVSKILIKRDHKLSEEQFFYIADKYKIEYIMYRGFYSAGDFAKEWYLKWKKAMGRDHRIDLILLED
jgi:hypothetical protein